LPHSRAWKNAGAAAAAGRGFALIRRLPAVLTRMRSGVDVFRL